MSVSHGGRHTDQARLDALVTKLWTEGRPVALIAQQLGFHHGSSISHAAKRLGLPRRRRPRNTAKALAGFAAMVARREAVVLAKLEERLKREKPTGPIPTVFRCVGCQGRSSDPNGHELCQARGVA